MRKKLKKISNSDASVLKNKITQYHKNKVHNLLLVDIDMSKIEDLYKDLIAKRNEILSQLKKVEGVVSSMNEEENLFQKELKREFGYEYSPKTWVTLYPSLLKKYLIFGDGSIPETRFYADISKIGEYLDLQIKKNHEKITPSQPQLITKVEI